MLKCHHDIENSVQTYPWIVTPRISFPEIYSKTTSRKPAKNSSRFVELVIHVSYKNTTSYFFAQLQMSWCFCVCHITSPPWNRQKNPRLWCQYRVPGGALSMSARWGPTSYTHGVTTPVSRVSSPDIHVSCHVRGLFNSTFCMVWVCNCPQIKQHGVFIEAQHKSVLDTSQLKVQHWRENWTSLDIKIKYLKLCSVFGHPSASIAKI